MRTTQGLIPRLALLGGLLVGAACSEADPKELTDSGATALNSGDAKAAVLAFDAALEAITPDHPEFMRASIGRCEALARTDPSRSKTDFLALATAQEQRVREQDYAAVANELLRHDALAQATEVVEAGLKRYPKSAVITGLRDRIGDAAKKASDPEALKKLKGLGYAGDG